MSATGLPSPLPPSLRRRGVPPGPPSPQPSSPLNDPDTLGPEELERLFPFLRPLREDGGPALATARSVTDFGAAEDADAEQDSTWLWGLALLALSGFVFVFGLYAAVIAPFMPETGVKLLDLIREDRYYSFLVPLTLPVTVILMVVNWVGFKVYRHN
ncbi:phosphatidylinositol N-acetylglucosaminyltransferase subunit Y-domain-containing protein [Hyaloraphidium curvatum]|nr:phosphatidylinositol N-acetylglucosaminyltransferase subunit Y-domain-containing protein [Hyaloraphidium curvatum]